MWWIVNMKNWMKDIILQPVKIKSFFFFFFCLCNLLNSICSPLASTLYWESCYKGKLSGIWRMKPLGKMCFSFFLSFPEGNISSVWKRSNLQKYQIQNKNLSFRRRRWALLELYPRVEKLGAQVENVNIEKHREYE